MYKFKARKQITLWGPTGEVCIGMVSSFLLSEFNARNQIILWGPRGEVHIGVFSSFLLSDIYVEIQTMCMY